MKKRSIGKEIKGANLLNKTKIYLAGPLQFQKNGNIWRERAEKELNKMGVICLNPYKKPFLNGTQENFETVGDLNKMMKRGEFMKVHKFCKRFRADDLRAVDISNAIICYISPKIVTFGTTDEISHALKQKKPVYIFIDGKREKTPLWIMAMVEPKWIFNNLTDVIKELKLVNAGKKVDNVRWKFLKEEFL